MTETTRKDQTRGPMAQTRDSLTLHHGGSFRKYMENKNNKLHDQFTAQATGSRVSNLFQGVTIHVNGLTNPGHAELRQLMAQHGGRFVNYYSKSTVTHIVCSSLTDAKVKIYKRERDPTPIVRPEWVVDSIQAGHLRPIEEYALAQLRDAPGQTRLLSFGPKNSKAHDNDNDNDKAISLAQAQEIAAQLRNECDVLKGPPRSSKDDPNFVESYYRASRLHFIGRWKARLEALIASSVALSAPAACSNKEQTRNIIHLDMDCFFASVAEAGHPELRGKPLVVSHSNSARGSGEVSSANYVARNYGITASMFISKAKELCPELIVVPYEFSKYEVVSEQVYRIMLKYTASVQPVSCDEAFLDVTGLGDPEVLACQIRQDIVQATGCTASAGIGSNMLLARLATKKAKPNGQYMLPKSAADSFLLKLKVSDLPGVGWSTERRLKELGIESVEDLRARSKEYLQREFGTRSGTLLWDFAHGHDSRVVEVPKGRKSVGAEVNWGIRFEKEKDPEDFLGNLAKEVEQRLNQSGVKGRTITVKIKRKKQGWKEPAKFLGCGHCDNLSRSITLARCVSSKEDLLREGAALLRALHVPFEDIRGMGLSVSKLQESTNHGSELKSHLISQKFAFHKQKSSQANPVSETSPASSSGWEDSEDQSKGEERNVDGPLGIQTVQTLQNIPKELAGKSLTQIDAEELAALPWLVQREVVNTLPRTRTTQAQKTLNHSDSRDEKREKSDTVLDDAKLVEPLPSFSQVDVSVLHALPIGLRMELENAWGLDSSKRAKRVKLNHKGSLGGRITKLMRSDTVSHRTSTFQNQRRKIDGYMMGAHQRRQREDSLEKSASITMSELDLSVLEELPKILQKEILADVGMQSTKICEAQHAKFIQRLESVSMVTNRKPSSVHSQSNAKAMHKGEEGDELVYRMRLVLDAAVQKGERVRETRGMESALQSVASMVSLETKSIVPIDMDFDTIIKIVTKAFDSADDHASNDTDKFICHSPLEVARAVIIIFGSRLIQVDLVSLRSFLRHLKSTASLYSRKVEELVNDAVEMLQQRMVEQHGCRLALRSPLDDFD